MGNDKTPLGTSTERQKRIRAIFEEAIVIPPGDRSIFLDQTCAGEPEMRSEVESALALDENSSCADLITETGPDDSNAGTREGQRIGPYRILQKLGEGGMGVVYLAEKEEPIRRRVALKIIKHGMDSKQVVARFEAERQALAMMDHPCVAQVFDAGATENGSPYFAMEYVRAVPITEHCDRQRLNTRERLELFQQVCEGVQHAHQKAIIHRDLKPSNVLVSYRNGKPTPKIIDFGVAKATEHRLTERTLFTEMGVLIGTPEYMSPEQAEMTGQSVDTRTDVYSLGVVLYELLVGALPFESRALRQAGFDEIRRKIREEEPSKPSTRLSSLDGERSTNSAKRRRTDLSILRRQLLGDLDWITMRALEKDRARRYGSPAELGADIERHLTSQPVLAGPPSVAYRARKFVKRHLWGVGAVAAGVLVLAAFAASMAVQAKRIAAERDLAQQAKADLESVVAFQAGMLSETDPEEMGRRLVEDLRRREAEARRTRGALETEVAAATSLFTGVNATNAALRVIDEEILARALGTLEERFGEQPLIDARLRQTIGTTYLELGLYERAEPPLKLAVETRKRVLGDDHPGTLRSMTSLANLYRNQGRFDEAEPVFLESFETRKRVLGDDHPDTLSSKNNLAAMYQYQGRYDEAEPLTLQTLEARKRVLGDDHPDTLRSKNNLALLYWNQTRYDEAVPLSRQILEIRKRVLGDDHPDTLGSKNNLAAMYQSQGRYDDAEPLYVQALEARKRVLGSDHRQTLMSKNNLAYLYAKQGRYDEAEPLYKQTLENQDRVLGDDHPDTLRCADNLASLYANQGRYDEAEPLYIRTLEIRERVLGGDHPDTASTLYNLACLEAVRGDRAKAMSWLRRSVDAGSADSDWMAKDPDLESLHGTDFDALVERARQNAAAQRHGNGP